MRRLGQSLFRTLVIATFALWFGGFTFYVSFVVPVGSEVLGSDRAQGFITQQVSHWLNVVSAFAIVIMLLETVRGRLVAAKRACRTELVMLVLMGAFLIALIWIHPIMDEMIDVEKRSISNRSRFYGFHRVYLWFSTFQWMFGWVWLFMAVLRWQNESDQNRQNS